MHWATYGVTVTNIYDHPKLHSIISSSYTQLSRAYQICSVIVVILKHINIDSNLIEQLVDHCTLMVIKYRTGIDGCKLSRIG
jgi:hypothetical protein